MNKKEKYWLGLAWPCSRHDPLGQRLWFFFNFLSEVFLSAVASVFAAYRQRLLLHLIFTHFWNYFYALLFLFVSLCLFLLSLFLSPSCHSPCSYCIACLLFYLLFFFAPIYNIFDSSLSSLLLCASLSSWSENWMTGNLAIFKHFLSYSVGSGCMDQL